MTDMMGLPPGYIEWLADLKLRIRSAQSRSVLAVNSEQIRLYHAIGCEILTRQSHQGWGANIIDRLSADLREAFPDMKGFSTRNLQYMRRFAKEYPDLEFVQQAAAKLAWFHIVVLLTKVSDRTQREWYALKAATQGWSRSTLEVQIKNHLYDRQGAALTNFDQHLEQSQASLAAQVLKDPYHFDVRHGTWTAFLTQSGGYVEGGT
jgi:predicted nuclease of restriction endonuclease-like (RecB) superfamily